MSGLQTKIICLVGIFGSATIIAIMYNNSSVYNFIYAVPLCALLLYSVACKCDKIIDQKSQTH